MMCIHNELTHILLALETYTLKQRVEFLTNAAMETGGEFKLPQPGNNWDSQRVEIKAHGIFAEGPDMPEAIRNWMHAASGQARIQGQLHRAEALLHLPLSISAADTERLRAACKTVLDNGRTAETITIANNTLARLNGLPAQEIHCGAPPLGDPGKSPAGRASQSDART